MNEAGLAKLSQPLDAARVKSRPNGRGGQLSYLEAHDVIRTANDIFGFGGWGHEVVELRQIDAAVVHNSDQKAGWCVAYVCVVRLTVEGCVPVSGIGYGDATEYRESAAVTTHELAAKEAEADAMKRALKNYGDQFGLALYDKQVASSGHVTSGQTQKAAPAAAKEKTPATPPETDALMARLVALSVEYKALVPDFDVTVIRVKATEKIGKPDYKAWLEKQIGLMETNIKAKQPSPFAIPVGAKA